MTQEEALNILKCGHNAYITGSAGSGKTHLLNTYINYLRDNGVSVGITASTGIAATHMNGVTIHSWSGIGVKDSLSDSDIHDLVKKRYLAKHFEKTNVLIIDEISMLHSFQLDMVDRICRAFKQNDSAFGGVQVVLCGDFFQLPPIGASRGTDENETKEVTSVYMAEAWSALNLKICYLEEQYRQKAENGAYDKLLSVLNDIRNDSVNGDTLELLNTCRDRLVEHEGIITKLYTHNCDVDRVNESALSGIGGKEHRYEMSFYGNKKLAETLEKNCLAPGVLLLKKGAIVMFVKNNRNEGYVNGTLGTVVDVNEAGYPVVRTKDGRLITAVHEAWRIEEEGKTKAEIRQIPLRLAWAITVHKSQGMSLDSAEIDLSHSFEKGMGYVALSRVRTLSGIKLLGLGEHALSIDTNILAFDKELLEKSKHAREEFSKLSKKEIDEAHKIFLASLARVYEKKLSTLDETRKLIEERLLVPEMAMRRSLTKGTIISHLEKLVAERLIDISYLRDNADSKRLKKVEDAFKKAGDDKLTPVRTILGNSFSFDEIRFGRLLINFNTKKNKK
ncbi:MAG: helix-turn-helix domain-containing protein [Candidatus Paceibacterota bacterium]